MLMSSLQYKITARAQLVIINWARAVIGYKAPCLRSTMFAREYAEIVRGLECHFVMCLNCYFLARGWVDALALWHVLNIETAKVWDSQFVVTLA